MFDKKDMKLKLVVGGSVILAVAAAGFIVISDDKDDETKKDSDSYVMNEDDVLEAVDYKDGSYYTEAEYFVPASGETDYIGVTVVIQDNKIASVKIDKLVDGEIVESEHNDAFNEKLTGIVVGKTIDETQDDVLVSGSTLTSDAFKDALKGIAENAR